MTASGEMKAYIAGFFDGEGSISCAKHGNTPFVRMTQNNPDILERIQDVYGGVLELRGSSNTWSLRLRRREQELFLTDLLPYLLQKRVQAILCLRRVRSPNLNDFAGQAREEERDLRRWIRLKITMLNAKWRGMNRELGI